MTAILYFASSPTFKLGFNSMLQRVQFCSQPTEDSSPLCTTNTVPSNARSSKVSYNYYIYSHSMFQIHVISFVIEDIVKNIFSLDIFVGYCKTVFCCYNVLLETLHV